MTPTEAQIESAIKVFAEHGIEFSAPWHGDMDDLERERFDALRLALSAALSQSPDALAGREGTEPVAWLVKGPGWGRVFLNKEVAEKLAYGGGEIVALYASPPSAGVQTEACGCTLIEQDETCPAGYPSLLCDICDGRGVITSAGAPTPLGERFPSRALEQGGSNG